MQYRNRIPAKTPTTLPVKSAAQAALRQGKEAMSRSAKLMGRLTMKFFQKCFNQDYPELCLDNDKTHELGFSNKAEA